MKKPVIAIFEARKLPTGELSEKVKQFHIKNWAQLAFFSQSIVYLLDGVPNKPREFSKLIYDVLRLSVKGEAKQKPITGLFLSHAKKLFVEKTDGKASLAVDLLKRLRAASLNAETDKEGSMMVKLAPDFYAELEKVLSPEADAPPDENQ